MDHKTMAAAKAYYRKLIADGYTDINAFDRTVKKFGALTAQEISIATDRAYQGKKERDK